MTFEWAADVSAGGRSGEVLGIRDVSDGVVLLLADNGTLFLVLVSASKRIIENTCHLSGISGLQAAHNAERNPFTISCDDTKFVTLIYRDFVVKVNTAVGVRNPCSSEDVELLIGSRQADSYLAVSYDSAHHRAIVLYDNGPSITAMRAFSGVASQITNLVPAANGGTHMSQRISSLLSAARVDSHYSLDEAVLSVNEEIVSTAVMHAGNWARANLHHEDSNLFTHVTRVLVEKQQEHLRFVREIRQQSDLAANISSMALGRIVSDQEKLASLVTIRNLQNHVTVKGIASYHNSAAASILAEAGGIVATLETTADATAERCQALLRQAVIDVAESLRDLLPTNSLATAAEITFSRPQHIVLLLHRLLSLHQASLQSSSLTTDQKLADSVAVGRIFYCIVATIDSSRDVHGKSSVGASGHGGVDEALRCFLWTGTADAQHGGVQTILAEEAVLLSDALAAAHQAGAQTPAEIQKELLDLTVTLLHFSFGNHSLRQSEDFCASALRRTLFRPPFVDQTLGYPFGTPMAQAPFLASKQSVVNAVLALASVFSIKDVLFVFGASHFAPDPEQTPESYRQLEGLCLKNPELYAYTLEQMAQQQREAEILALPTLLPRIDESGSIRNAFLETSAPYLLWQVDGGNFSALRREGADATPPVEYGVSRLEHRSRCLSMAKLAWISCGAPSTTQPFHELEIDVTVVAAQQKFLSSSTSDSVLTVNECVRGLVGLDSIDAWISAATMASMTASPLRGELNAMVLQRALEADGVESLIALQTTAVSEKEILDKMKLTSIGKLLESSSALRDPLELEEGVRRVVTSQGDHAQLLLQLLTQWIHLHYSSRRR